MLLCLDIGNTHIFGGVFKSNTLALRFRHSADQGITSDQIGIFLKNVLHENGFDYKLVKMVAISSVVPAIDYTLRAACIKYFRVEPFILEPTQQNIIKIKTKNPKENGADLIAGVIAATHHHPKKNLLVVDLGTVTTITAVTKNKEYLGATFIPGLKTAMTSLSSNTAKLFSVEIMKPKAALGRTTSESIQAGLFYGHLGAIKEIVKEVSREVFPKSAPLLIATGGFARFFSQQKLFHYTHPDLVLQGIKIAYEAD
jgi:type III pantothenate kinase